VFTVTRDQIDDQHIVCCSCGDVFHGDTEDDMCCGGQNFMEEFYIDGSWYLENEIEIVKFKEEYLP
jgi:hypothetical protein